MDGVCISEKLGFQKPQAEFLKDAEVIGTVNKDRDFNHW